MLSNQGALVGYRIWECSEMSQTDVKTIFSKEYHGFEDCVDIYRDISEMFDPRLNPDSEGLCPEFQGTIKIEVTYQERE